MMRIRSAASTTRRKILAAQCCPGAVRSFAAATNSAAPRLSPGPTSPSSAASSHASPAAASSAPGPLAGIKVLDLSRILAGPFCTQILGDMGATIIKVEHPIGGDDTRMWGPPFVKAKETPVIHSARSTANQYVSIGESAYFLAANRNKSSVCVNLKTPEGIEIIQSLAKGCDVLVENFLPGRLDAMGLGFETLSKLNPSLIYASLTGFGDSGPFASRPGYDVMAAARGGLMHVTGSESEPAKVGVAVTDLSAGLYLHGAILAALFARERDPQRRGQRVSTNLLEVQVANLANIGQNHLVDPKRTGRRWGTNHESIVPYGGFRCRPDASGVAQTPLPPPAAAVSPAPSPSSTTASAASDHIILGALNNSQFKSLGAAVAELCAMHPNLGLDASFMLSPNYANNALRVKHRTVLLDSLQHVFSHFPVGTLLRLLDAHAIPNAPINDLAQVYQDPQVQYSGIVQQVEHSLVGSIKVAGPPVHYSRTPVQIHAPPPCLGEHTQTVLQSEMGASAEQLQEWERAGVIGCYHQVK